MIRSLFFLSILPLLFSCNERQEKTQASVSKEEELKSLLSKYPDSLLVIENIVQYYRDKGDYSKALKITDDAIRKDSNEAMFWDMKATLHFENEDTVGAINAYNKLIRIEPMQEHIVALGSIYAQHRDPKALEIADQLIETDKSAERDALLIKGMYYNFTGDKKQAISYFDQCILQDYTYMLAYREKAIALYDLAMYADALKVLQTATTLQTSYEEGYFWMGKCYEKLGKKNDAVKAYEMALLYDKNFVEAKEAIEKLSK